MSRTQVLKHLPGPRKGKRGGSKGNVRRGAIKKSRYIRVIEGDKVKKDDSIEYFLLTVVRSTF